MAGEIIQYQTEDGVTVIRLQASDGSVWLSQAEMAELFQTTKQSISLHVRNILEERELEETATVKENLTVQTEGKRKVSRQILLYNLQMILAVGFRAHCSFRPCPLPHPGPQAMTAQKRSKDDDTR